MGREKAKKPAGQVGQALDIIGLCLDGIQQRIGQAIVNLGHAAGTAAIIHLDRRRSIGHEP